MYITDEEAAAIDGMPPAIAAGFLAAKRRDKEHGYDDIRTFLDNVGMDVAQGDPVKGQRVAEFNDMLIDKLKKRAE